MTDTKRVVKTFWAGLENQAFAINLSLVYGVVIPFVWGQLMAYTPPSVGDVALYCFTVIAAVALCLLGNGNGKLGNSKPSDEDVRQVSNSKTEKTYTITWVYQG